jgi:hypothetical protein
MVQSALSVYFNCYELILEIYGVPLTRAKWPRVADGEKTTFSYMVISQDLVGTASHKGKPGKRPSISRRSTHTAVLLRLSEYFVWQVTGHLKAHEQAKVRCFYELASPCHHGVAPILQHSLPCLERL